jgi:hypothetical protein
MPLHLHRRKTAPFLSTCFGAKRVVASCVGGGISPGGAVIVCVVVTGCWEGCCVSAGTVVWSGRLGVPGVSGLESVSKHAISDGSSTSSLCGSIIGKMAEAVIISCKSSPSMSVPESLCPCNVGICCVGGIALSLVCRLLIRYDVNVASMPVGANSIRRSESLPSLTISAYSSS